MDNGPFAQVSPNSLPIERVEETLAGGGGGGGLLGGGGGGRGLLQGGVVIVVAAAAAAGQQGGRGQHRVRAELGRIQRLAERVGAAQGAGTGRAGPVVSYGTYDICWKYTV